MKKIKPCKLLKKVGANAYEIELPDGIGISLIFNVSNLYPYKDGVEAGNEKLEVQWMMQEHRQQVASACGCGGQLDKRQHISC
jgi:hypothetical protein